MVRLSVELVFVSEFKSCGSVKSIAAEPDVLSVPNGTERTTPFRVNGVTAKLTEPEGEKCQDRPVWSVTCLITSSIVFPAGTVKSPPS